jgi:hypothetical protein
MSGSTLIQQLGFADRDLGSPEHDRLVAWLAQPAALLAVVRCAWPDVLAEKRRGAEVVALDTTPDEVWERIVGTELEQPILRAGQYVVGFVDLVARVGWGANGRTIVQARFYVEAKPEIRSVGALLRQINLYRAFVADGHWIVVCNADRYRDLLAGQGVALVTRADVERAGEVGAAVRG